MRARRLILAAFLAVPVAGCGCGRTDPPDVATAVPPVVLDAYAPPDQFPRVDRQVFAPVLGSLRLSEAGAR